MRLMKSIRTGLQAALLLSLMLSSLETANAASARRRDVLIVPARYRTVQIGFDVQALRNPAFITYQTPQQGGLIHIWRPNSRSWQRLLPEDIEFGQFMTAVPAQVIVVGPPEDLPASLTQGFIQNQAVLWIESLSSADILNTLNQRYQFTSSEWHALAQRYNLKIEDLNAERRRWGRFGPPGTQRQPPAIETKHDDQAVLSPHSIDSITQAATPTNTISASEPITPAPEPEPESTTNDNPEALFQYLLEYQPKDQQRPRETVTAPQKPITDALVNEQQDDQKAPQVTEEKGRPTPSTDEEAGSPQAPENVMTTPSLNLILDLEPETETPEYK